MVGAAIGLMVLIGWSLALFLGYIAPGWLGDKLLPSGGRGASDKPHAPALVGTLLLVPARITEPVIGHRDASVIRAQVTVDARLVLHSAPSLTLALAVGLNLAAAGTGGEGPFGTPRGSTRHGTPQA